MIGNKMCTEAAGVRAARSDSVEERSTPLRRSTVRTAGACASAYVGMSNDNAGENPARRKSEVSWGR